ncbi:MAG TPA: C45 family peptidase [Sorangium sp.]|nr:C45 family peptidase [Sorangium sp.]
MPLPFLDLSDDDPEARGRAHGGALAVQIARNIETCYRRFENNGLDRGEVRRKAAAWAELVRRERPDYDLEMRAVAAGAMADPLDVAIVNLRFEIGFPLMARRAAAMAAEADGCTSFAVLPEASADLQMRIGQTLDGIAAIAGNLAVIRSRRSARVTVLGLHEAGSVGPSVGLNSCGVGVVYNSLITPECADPPQGLPFRLRVLGVLESGNFARALDVALQAPRPTATHLLLGHRDGEAVGLELASRRAAYLHPEQDIMTHANHIERLAGVTSLFERLLPDSVFRGARLRRHLAARRGALDEAALHAALADHFSYPSSICLHGDGTAAQERRAMTLAGIILNLTSGVLGVTDGPPCAGALERFSLTPPQAPA